MLLNEYMIFGVAVFISTTTYIYLFHKTQYKQLEKEIKDMVKEAKNITQYNILFEEEI